MSIGIMTMVWNSAGTSGSLRLMLLAIADQANDQGECWPSIATLARKAGVHRRHAITLIGALESAGYINIEHRKITKDLNQTNRYYINLKALEGGSVPQNTRVVSPSAPGSVPQNTRVVSPSAPGSVPQNTRVVSPSAPKPLINHQLTNSNNSNFALVVELYTNNIGLVASEMLGKKLGDWADTYPIEWVEEAIKIAVENGARNYAYINTILSRWEKDGYKVDTRKRKASKGDGVLRIDPATNREIR